MKAMLFNFILWVAIVLTGCASVNVSQDYDPDVALSRLGTWQWRHPKQPLTGDVRVDNPLLDKRIREAIATHMASRNITWAQSKADLQVVYYLAIEPKILSDSYYSTLGYGGYYHPWYGGFATETRIRQYDESRLTIDIHAGDTDELLWRGVGTYRFKTFQTPQKAAEAVQKTVDKILRQFPPNNKN